MIITEIIPRFLVWFKIKNRGQDRGIDKHTLPHHLTTTNITTRLKNNNQPESSENQAM